MTAATTLQAAAPGSGARPVHRQGSAPGPVARQVRDLLLVLIAGLALLTAGTAGYALATPPPPTTDSAEAGFARDMSGHHAQAVRMALTARDRMDDPELRFVALDIAVTQQGQIGMMTGWLHDWGLNTSDGSQQPMAWMRESEGHGSGHTTPGDGAAPGEMLSLLPDGRMPGMASKADLDQLGGLRGRDAEVLFLRLMITHHRGGVAMARAGVAALDRPAERLFAQSVVDSQGAEITYLQTLLRRLGAPPA